MENNRRAGAVDGTRGELHCATFVDVEAAIGRLLRACRSDLGFLPSNPRGGSSLEPKVAEKVLGAQKESAARARSPREA
jgi:hypothetical protein